MLESGGLPSRHCLLPSDCMEFRNTICDKSLIVSPFTVTLLGNIFKNADSRCNGINVSIGCFHSFHIDLKNPGCAFNIYP